jgi:NAD(P)-dependent dehydrogenase (short-subunit alcohol dehydrogenase family)
MARVFITGSSDGLGLMAAKLLIEQGHEVVLHGRNDGRSRDALLAANGAQGAVSGDLSIIAGATTVANAVNKLGRFDAVIHNAGIDYRETRRVETEPGVPSVFAVNVLAPYILKPPVGAISKHPARLYRPSRQASRAHSRGKPGFLTYESGFGGDGLAADVSGPRHR